MQDPSMSLHDIIETVTKRVMVNVKAELPAMLSSMKKPRKPYTRRAEQIAATKEECLDAYISLSRLASKMEVKIIEAAELAGTSLPTYYSIRRAAGMSTEAPDGRGPMKKTVDSLISSANKLLEE